MPESSDTDLDVIVIGAGQAGLAASYFLGQRGLKHEVLERAQVGEAWRSQRWASFRLNTPNWASGLPGMPLNPDNPDGFASAEELVDLFEAYRAEYALPVRTGVEVVSLSPNGAGYNVRTAAGETLAAPQVIVASGMQNKPRIPAYASDLPRSVLQLHSAQYRTPDALPPGAALVIGGGQSGLQVAEDLLNAGRQIYLAASRVARVPRHYRGHDIIWWLRETRFFAQTPADLSDPAMIHAAQPQLAGTSPAHTASYQHLARRGATIVGHSRGVQDGTLLLEPNALECIEFADEGSEQIRTMIDEYIAESGLDAPPRDDDPDDNPDPDIPVSSIESLDLEAEGISSIIWCTGVAGDFRWLPESALDERGQPLHEDGVSPLPGLYYLGLPWLARRNSGILLGIGDDAERITSTVAAAHAH